MKRTPFLTALIVSLPALVLLVALIIRNPAGDFWKSVEAPKAQCEAYDAERIHSLVKLSEEIYDQAKLNRLIREPQNTVSNLSYAFAGLAVLLAARRPASIGLGLAAIFLGWGSGMYHATLLPEWRMIDILGVYAVLYSLVWIGVSHHFGKRRGVRAGWIGTVLVLGLAVYTGVHRNDVRIGGVKIFDSTYVFIGAATAGMCMALIACTRSTNRIAAFRFLILMMLCATVSFSGGIGDRFGGFWASAQFPIQGHAVWHTFGAFAMLAAYEVFASTGFDESIFSPSRGMGLGGASRPTD
jgi:hypothetical protein